MIAIGVPANTQTYNVLIDACVRDGEVMVRCDISQFLVHAMLVSIGCSVFNDGKRCSC